MFASAAAASIRTAEWGAFKALEPDKTLSGCQDCRPEVHPETGKTAEDSPATRCAVGRTPNARRQFAECR